MIMRAFMTINGTLLYLTTQILYIYILVAIYKLRRAFFSCCRNDNIDETLARLHWNEINVIIHRFEKLFNIFPLIWFTNAFVKCATYVITVDKKTYDSKMEVFLLW